MSARKRVSPRPKFARVYWDSCIFIAWLTGEPRPQIELDGLREAVEQASRGEARVVVSRIFETEVLVDAMPGQVKALLQKFLRQDSVEVIDLEPPILQLATEIRTYYRIEKQRGTSSFVPSMADSLHLATAINRKVDAFYTFDRGGKDKASLLSLDRNVAGYPLAIHSPPATQLTLAGVVGPSLMLTQKPKR